MAVHDGKVAIVTGGAQGIGYAVVERLLRDGAKVVLADINDEGGLAAVEELSEFGTVKYVHCDVAERLDIHNLVASTLEAFGDIDFLVNNAGIVSGADFLDFDPDDFERVININLKGSFLLAQAVGRHMVEKVKDGGVPGAIVNMSSINSVVAIPDQVAYCVSKGGIQQLTKAAALSLAPYGIRVNAVGPGSIMTPMLAAVNTNAEARRRMLSRTPMQRVGETSEVASVISFLMSSDAGYITGETIFIDGGRLGLNYLAEVPEDA